MRAASLQSVMFDAQRRAATPELKAAIKSLIAYLEQREADLKLRKRARREAHRRSFHLAVEAIVCNLVGLALTGLDWPLAVPRSSGVMWAKGRYNVAVYGQHFLDALDLMSHPEVALIDDLSRGYSFAGGHTQRSTVSPTPAFNARVRPALAGWESFFREEEREVLIMKGPKDRKTGNAELVDYPETANTRRRRKEIQRINQMLRNAPVRLAVGGATIGLTDEGQPVDPTRRSVRRIFNNGSWYAGGRLFDGFWENMRRGDRGCLRICTLAHPEGESVANVDFNQLFPTLAYRSSLSVLRRSWRLAVHCY